MKLINSLLLLSSLFIGSSLAQTPPFPVPDINLPNVVIDGFTDPAACYGALEAADLDGDRDVDADEYAVFVQGLGPDGFLAGVTSFAELPFSLQTTFTILACICRTDPTDDACCVGDAAALNTSGAFAGETPTSAQQSYLFLVCSYTGTAIDHVLSTGPPTTEPSGAPTNVPTKSPTPVPTKMPTTSPTKAPTTSPTPAPVSPAPTPSPTTLAPTLSPTTATPTLSPTTAEPSAAPTTSEPSSTPSQNPTVTPEPTAPTATPSESPTDPPLDIAVTVTYEVAFPSGTSRSVYEPQLVGAMDALAPEVLSFLRRQLRVGRRLQTVTLPTTIDSFSTITCPNNVKDADDVCEEVTADIVLLFQPTDSNPQGTADQFEVDLVRAMDDGDLQEALDNTTPGAAIYILTGRGPITQNIPEDGEGISAGGVAGVVVASLVGVGLLIGFLVSRRQEPKEDLEELEPANRDLNLGDTETDTAKAHASHGEATLGATTPDYGNTPDLLADNEDEDGDKSSDHKSHGSSASAGSSGWSSSAGVSSLNTGSADGLDVDPSSGIGTTLAAMTAQSKPPLDAPDSGVPVVSRSDLDSAIESGDWAAVGATAALLAAASDSQSYSSHSQSRSALEGSLGRSGTTSTSSLDAARAAELDHLVDAGDWEGVVLAAARYEASESESRSGSRSMTHTQDSSLASSPSKQQKRKEMRAIVEELVRRVVPEEIENVDEMMLQFRGREEELVETLRTMEERAVAQKARQGAQKAAKLEAKQAVTAARAAEGGSQKKLKTEKGDVAGKSLGTGTASKSTASKSTASGSGKSLGSGSMGTEGKSKSLGTGAIKSDEKSKKQTALERAIEAGDWEAVGEAAAMLSDHGSTASADTDEINRLADGLSSQGSAGSRGSVGADELDELIDRGDWTGVVQAASKYDKPKEKVLTKEEEEAARRERRMKHLQAEQEALQQADIWMAIAEQTAAESDTKNENQGAKEAVDWAINRTLSALVNAEAQGSLRDRSRSPPTSKTIKEDDEEDDEEEEV